MELRVPKALLDALLTGPPPGVEPYLWSAWAPVLADIAAGYAAALAAPQPDPRRRTPDTALRLKVVTAIQYCVGPFCHVPSRRTQIDHGNPHARGGPTLFHNLGPLCGGQHRQKTKGHAVMQRIGLWTFRWTTRLGAIYEVVVPPLLDDLPDPDPTPSELPDNPAPRERLTVEDDPATVAATWIPRQRPGRDWPAFDAAEIRAARTAHEAARRAWIAKRDNPDPDDIPPF